MKIDIINTVEPKKPKVPKEEGLSLDQRDSPISLSSPFVNPYRTSMGNTKGKTAAERNNNPFNIKFGSFAAKFGATKENKAALDGGSFATFPTVEAGIKAAQSLLTGKNYRNLTVDQAMRRWSNKGYGGEIFPEIANRTIASLNPRELDTLQRKQIVREDRNYAKKLGFLDGANLPKYKYGGNIDKKPKPLVVNNPNDPRLQAYKDSSALYNNYQELTKALKQKGYRVAPKQEEPGIINRFINKFLPGANTPKETDSWKMAMNVTKNFPKSSGLQKKGTLEEVDDFVIGTINKNLPKQLFSRTIKPSGTTDYLKELGPKDLNNVYSSHDEISLKELKSLKPAKLMNGEDYIPDVRTVAKYDNVKPKQEVIYQPEIKKVIQSIVKSKPKIIPKQEKINIDTKPIEKEFESTTVKLPDINIPTKFPIKLKEDLKDLPSSNPRETMEAYQKRLAGLRKENPNTYKTNTNQQKYKYGGKLPKYEYGSIIKNPNSLQNGLDKYVTPQALNSVIKNNTGTIPTSNPSNSNGFNNYAGVASMGLGLAGSALENLNAKPDKVNKGASIGAGALKGASTGLALGGAAGTVIPGIGNAVGGAVGAAAGAIAGGITGLVKANKRQRLIDQNIRSNQTAFNTMQADRSANLYRQLNPYVYKFGGNLNFAPEYEVEKGEVVQGDAILQEGKQIANGLQEVNGKTHEKGGSFGAGGDRVFSNSISLNGQTPAQMAKAIGSKIKKFEPDLTSKDFMKRKTAEVMTQKLTGKLDEVFANQESAKNIPKYKYGGNIPKMADGGYVDEKREAIKRRIKTLDNYLKANTKRQALAGSDPKDALRAERAQLQAQLDNPAIWTGQVFNPLDTTKNVLYPTRPNLGPTENVAWTNNLNEAVVKGNRPTLPVKKISGANKTASPFKRNSFDVSEIDNTISPNTTNRLASGLSGSQIQVPTTAKNNNSSTTVTQSNKPKIDPTLVTGLGLAGIGYLNNAANINRMNTDVAMNQVASPYYNYADRSRVSRANLNSVASNILNNPNITPAQKQAMFARYAGGINQINDQENANRFAYDTDFNNRDFQIRAQNNAIVNQAINQRTTNQNNQIASRMDNFNNLLTNINTVIAEQNARRAQDRRFSLLSDTYRKIYNTDFDIKQ